MIARGQPRCDPVFKLHRSNNECISPMFHDKKLFIDPAILRQEQHTNACNVVWSRLGDLSWLNADVSEPTNPPQPLGVQIKSPTFGARIVGPQNIFPLIELQLLQHGMTELDPQDKLCFWIHQVTAPLKSIQRDVVELEKPTSCSNVNEIMRGVLAPLNVPDAVGSYIVACQMRRLNVARSGVAYTLVDRYPMEIHEWGNIFGEDRLPASIWWSESNAAAAVTNSMGGGELEGEGESSSNHDLSAIVLFHNRASSTSREITRAPLFGRRIPKIIHQIWTGGEKELEHFHATLEQDDKRYWFAQWRKTCTDLHPESRGWQHMFWDLITMRQFVLEKFPAMLKQYDNMDLNIKRTDLFRMLVLLQLGGTYVDIDFECLRPFETIMGKSYGREPLDMLLRRERGVAASSDDLSGGTMTVTLETTSSEQGAPPLLYLSEHRTNLPLDHILKGRELPNAFMASIKWHPLIWLVTMEMLRRDAQSPGGYVTHTTGPHVFSEIVFQYLSVYGGGGSGSENGSGSISNGDANAKITILPISDLFPAYCLDKKEMARDAQCVREGNCKTLYPETAAVHHYAMSWWPEVKEHMGF